MFFNKKPEKSILITIAVAITAAIICTALTGCSLFKSDEEKIKDRIADFTSAYNAGDLDAVLNCMDSKTRNKFKSAMNIAETVGGTMLGMNVSLSDMFGLGVGMMSDEDVMTIDVRHINKIGNDRANAKAMLIFRESGRTETCSARFIMVKEKGQWYIKDLEQIKEK